MSGGFWERQPVPLQGSMVDVLAVWQPVSLRDITAHRRELSAQLDLAAGADVKLRGAVERLLLCVEELASNALRHGRSPVEVRITADERFWVVEVSDAAPDVPPDPAVDRDPADGGLGLYVVARVCGAHGWATDGERKTLWARIDYSRAEVPVELLAGIPKPRLSVDGIA